jgi:hypothetical protein
MPTSVLPNDKKKKKIPFMSKSNKINSFFAGIFSCLIEFPSLAFLQYFMFFGEK